METLNCMEELSSSSKYHMIDPEESAAKLKPSSRRDDEPKVLQSGPKIKDRGQVPKA